MSGGVDHDCSLAHEIAWGVEHDLFQDEVGRSLMRAYDLGVADEQILGMLRRRIDRARVDELRGNRVPFRASRLHCGSIVLGRDGAVAGNVPVRVPMQWLNAGMLFTGSSGSSKTNTAKWLLPQIAAHVPGLWLMEQYKSELRHLAAMPGVLADTLIVMPHRDMRFNLLQPDGTTLAHHETSVVDLLAQITHVPGRGRSILRAVTDLVYQPYRGADRASWPTLIDIFEAIRADSSLNFASRDALLDRLGSLLLQMGSCARYRTGWTARQLAQHRIVFEFAGAGRSARQMLMVGLLRSIMESRVAEGRVNAALNLVVLFEDAQRVLSGESDPTGDIAPLDELTGLIRGTGTCIWPSIQSLDGVSEGILANLATKFMGRLGTAGDYARLSAHLGMTQEQRRWCQLHLRPGLLVVQVAEGDWRHPVLLEIPHVQVPADISDAEVAVSQAPLRSLPTCEATEYADWHPWSRTISITSDRPQSPEKASDGDVPSEPQDAQSEAEAPKQVVVSSDELRILRAIAAAPGLASGQIAKAARMGASKAGRLRRELVQRGLVRIDRVATGHRGPAAQVCQLTASGRAAIG